MSVRRLSDRQYDRLYRKYEEANHEYHRLARYGLSAARTRAERRMLRLEKQVRSAARRRRGRSSGDKRRRHRKAGAPSFGKQRYISRKIRRLHREGYEGKQAVAIAYRYAGVAKRRRRRSRR